MLYTEELTINRNSKPYVNGSYFRVVTMSHIIEVFKYLNQTTPNYTLAATNRRTGRDLGEMQLPNEYPVKMITYMRTENLLIIKYNMPDPVPSDLNHT